MNASTTLRGLQIRPVLLLVGRAVVIVHVPVVIDSQELIVMVLHIAANTIDLAQYDTTTTARVMPVQVGCVLSRRLGRFSRGRGHGAAAYTTRGWVELSCSTGAGTHTARRVSVAVVFCAMLCT